MTSKPETIAQMRRKIERLEAKIEALQALRENDFQGLRKWLGESVEYSARISQAMRILSGEDDA